MNYNIFIGIAAGIVFYIIIRLILKFISKSMKINPLLGLVGFYILFNLMIGKTESYFPESWSNKLIDTPYQTTGTIGFLLNLDHPKMSIIDVAFTVFFVCLILQFVGVFLFHKTFWGGRRKR